MRRGSQILTGDAAQLRQAQYAHVHSAEYKETQKEINAALRIVEANAKAMAIEEEKATKKQAAKVAKDAATAAAKAAYNNMTLAEQSAHNLSVAAAKADKKVQIAAAKQQQKEAKEQQLLEALQLLQSNGVVVNSDNNVEESVNDEVDNNGADNDNHDEDEVL